ncbi:hypothetical protein [Streptomyces sp. BE133]|uniref:hypothetical protein n=1 Tax=Streptomyces sp. BE133 TaxID=3002523 RepID=UPI002E76CDFA|nr:hypothetical protein [Streptomyces sp. BE133]MEE1811809.1 hypothetical protein [Streptomyces sp. BE133]
MSNTPLHHLGDEAGETAPKPPSRPLASADTLVKVVATTTTRAVAPTLQPARLLLGVL